MRHSDIHGSRLLQNLPTLDDSLEAWLGRHFVDSKEDAGKAVVHSAGGKFRNSFTSDLCDILLAAEPNPVPGDNLHSR